MMDIHQLNIEEKHRRSGGFLADLKDFSYVDGGIIHPHEVIDNPQISLYCFDDSNRRAIFVELPANIDLTKAPFVYQTQYEFAQRLIAVPYERFTELANTLPEVHRPIFIYMTGRSGSTLLSHVFNASHTVVSLSESDVATQFVHLRHNTGGMCDHELRSLAKSTLRFLFKSYHAQHVHAYALKFRSEGLRVMDLFQTTFPHAKNLFLYRDAIGVVTSFYRILRQLNIPEYSSVSEWQHQFEAFFHADFSHFRAYIDDRREDISIPEQLTLGWIVTMESYLAQIARGCPVLAVRYADLIQFREQTLRSIFAYCGLPTSNVPQGLRAFDNDAQAGTVLARENSREGNTRTLNEEQIRSVMAILQRHQVLNTSDFNAPGTLKIGRNGE